MNMKERHSNQQMQDPKIYIPNDTQFIPYRRHFVELTDNSLSAILLQQMIFYSNSKEGKSFYKFRTPCNHKLYTAGDSWCECLACSPSQFDNALKIIATKVTTGTNRKALEKTDFPRHEEGETIHAYEKRFAAALKCCVLYWIDSNRITNYKVNKRLVDMF